MKLLCLLLSLSFVVYPCPQQAFAPTQQVQKTQLVLNGIGMRLATFLNFKVYAAGLYLPKKGRDLATISSTPGPKLIDLYFLRNVDKEDIVKAWNKGHGLGQFPQELSALNSFMTDMKKKTHGLQLQILQNGLTVKVAGKPMPKINNPAFAKAMLNLFLGPKPPNEELREGMLGTIPCK